MQPLRPGDAGAGTARLNQHGELEPIAVDESLTTLLFAPRQAPAPAQAPVVAVRDESVVEPRPAARPAALLFEMV